jgi:hypothetical protein
MSENSRKPFIVPPFPDPTGPLSTYEKYLAQSLAVVKSSYFRGQPVHLDGYRFEGCRFDNCQIFINSTNFELDHCIVDPSSVVIFGDGLLKIIRLFNRDAQWPPHLSHWGPLKNTDGTISVVGDKL